VTVDDTEWLAQRFEERRAHLRVVAYAADYTCRGRGPFDDLASEPVAAVYDPPCGHCDMWLQSPAAKWRPSAAAQMSALVAACCDADLAVRHGYRITVIG
jgi:hypothetical protein